MLAVLPPVHPALVDDKSDEVPVSSTLPQLPYAAAVDVRPGDHDAATAIEAWLQAYATSRDPVLRERITLAYLGLADRLAGRYRYSRGTTPEDLVQTARAGLIAAIDRYDPDYGTRFVPYAVACVVGELKRHLRDASWRLHVPRPLKERALRLYRTADELHQRWGRFPPPASWPSSWRWVRRRSWRRWPRYPAARRCRWISRSATPTFTSGTCWRRQ